MDVMTSTKPALLPLLSSASALPPIKPKLTPYPNSIPTTLDQTKQLHAHLIRTQFHPPSQLNLLISSYIRFNRPTAALKFYYHARQTRTPLDTFAIPSILKACAQISTSQLGREIHGFVLKSGLDWDIFVHNSLIQMYSECGDMDSAEWVFAKMPERDVVSWSTMIRSYGQIKCFDDALGLIRDMLKLGVKPSEVATINMLNIFADVGDLTIGLPMHGYLIKNVASALPGVNACTALIDMYNKCGGVERARMVFDWMVERSTASWTAMIAGYIRAKDLEAGLELFGRMREENVAPNEITMLSLVLECGLGGELCLGKWLHAHMVRNGFEMSVVLATAVVDMYCKCGDVRSARALFDRMRERDVMTWTAMIWGYSQANCLDEAFELFAQMKDCGIQPNEMTMVNLLTLCAEAGALDRGRWVHAFIDKQGIENDIVLATALIDMYSKCGETEAAERVFNEAVDRDVCMWNAMLNGLAMNGLGKEVIQLFRRMEMERNVRPNDVTFVGVLRACSHSGKVVEGKQFFNQMGSKFGLVPKVEHYGCMVDLLGRAGLLDEAHEMAKTMPVEPNVIVWGSLLAACKVHKNPKLGEVVARELLKLEPQNSGYNVLLSNIYASQKRWKDVAEVRRTMKNTGLKKAPGMSSIEVNAFVHEFVMGDESSHPEAKRIRGMLDEMQRELKQAGHVADTSVVLLNVDEEEKENALNYHSEKLAMAFGLISTAPSTPLRIVKNLRVCDDCHAATKLLSKIYRREIIVRDRNRFHRFSQGSCSCRDYW